MPRAFNNICSSKNSMYVLSNVERPMLVALQPKARTSAGSSKHSSIADITVSLSLIVFSHNAQLTRNLCAGVCVTKCERSEHHTNASA